MEGSAVTAQTELLNEDHMTPPPSATLAADTHFEAPVTDRSFFIQTEKVNASGLVTPIDVFSGIPLPILPTKNSLPLNKSEIADWHHPFHPKESPLLKTTGGLALRNCRVQLVHRDFHNESPTRYHKFFEGPPIPESEDEQFRTVVLACAGYIPRLAISTRSGEPRIVELTPEQERRLRQTQRKAREQDECTCDVHDKNGRGTESFGYRDLRYSYAAVKTFLAEHTIEQPLNHLKESIIDEFLHTDNPERRVYLGHLILVKKVEVATDKIDVLYKKAQSDKLLHPRMPQSVTNFVKYKLGNAEMRQRLFPRLAAQLAVFHGVSGLTIRGQRATI